MRERSTGSADFNHITPDGGGRDVVVIGTSTGGVEALTSVVHGLPENLPAAVCIVMHVPAHGHSYLPRILSRQGPLPAAHAMDGAPLSPGRIYIAPPDRHLIVEPGRLRLSHGPKENRARPAVDPLFRSAALAYGPRVTGVVLTGALDDGTAGLGAIKERGGVAVVQDPKEAFIPGMPKSALDYVDVDYCVRLTEMPALLARLAREPLGSAADTFVPDLLRYEARMAEMDEGTMERADTPGTLSSLSCPECGGPIYELQDGKLVRFRCRSGHAYNSESMAAGQAEAIEEALWVAINALMESWQLSERLASSALRRGHTLSARQFAARAAEAQRRADLLRSIVRAGDDREASPEGEESDATEVDAAELDEHTGTSAGA